MTISRIPPRTLSIVLIGCGTVFAFALLILFPGYRHSQSLDREIAEMEARIGSQRALFPMFRKLLEASREKMPEELPLPPPERLARGETGRLREQVMRIGGRTGVAVTGVTPDVASLVENSESLGVRLTARGDFFKLRDFLLQFAALPYLEAIERMELSPVPEGKKLQLQFRVLQE